MTASSPFEWQLVLAGVMAGLTHIKEREASVSARKKGRSSVTLKEKGPTLFVKDLCFYAFLTRILPHAFCKKQTNKNKREEEKGRYEY